MNPPRADAFFKRFIALLVASSALFLLQLGRGPVVSEEFRWAEIAREMLATGDFFRPTINGTIYYDKPVLSYWFIVAVSPLTGGVNEWAARLPAAIAGVLGVALLALLGRKACSGNVGLLAGAILATSFGFTFYARRASADMETVTGVLAALALYYWNRHRGGAWVIALWALMAFTSLTKGLLGFALPIVVMTTDTALAAWRKRSFRSLFQHGRWIWNRWSLLAIPLGIALYLLPFLLSMKQTGANDGLQMVWRENLKRFVNPHNHIGPWYLYFGAIFVLALPWSAFLPAAILGKSRSEGERFFRIYFGAIFVFFTLSASRRNYYLLPVLPPLAILLAELLLRPVEELEPIRRKLKLVGAWILRVGICACGLVLLSPADVLPPPYDAIPPVPYRGAFLAGFILALVFWFAKRCRPWPTAIVAFALFLYGFGIAWPAYEDLRTRREFVREVHALRGSEPVVLFHARDIVFDFGSTAPEFTDAAELKKALERGDAVWVLARRRYLEGAGLPVQMIAEERSLPWEPADQAGNKFVLLKAVR